MPQGKRVDPKSKRKVPTGGTGTIKPKLKSGDGNHQRYVYCRAYVDCGSLRWEYQVKGLPAGRLDHDEDVEGWSEQDIVSLTRQMLHTGDDERIDVIYL